MKITKQELMIALDRNFRAAQIRITVSRYNKILTDLGFSLADSPVSGACERLEVSIVKQTPMRGDENLREQWWEVAG